MVPRLSALHKDIRFGLEKARVVKARHADADHVRPGRHLDVERRTAIAAKDAADVVAGVRFGDIDLWRALGDAELGRGQPHSRDVGGTALPLAVSAMAHQREDRLTARDIANGAA